MNRNKTYLTQMDIAVARRRRCHCRLPKWRYWDSMRYAFTKHEHTQQITFHVKSEQECAQFSIYLAVERCVCVCDNVMCDAMIAILQNSFSHLTTKKLLDPAFVEHTHFYGQTVIFHSDVNGGFSSIFSSFRFVSCLVHCYWQIYIVCTTYLCIQFRLQNVPMAQPVHKIA